MFECHILFLKARDKFLIVVQKEGLLILCFQCSSLTWQCPCIKGKKKKLTIGWEISFESGDVKHLCIHKDSFREENKSILKDSVTMCSVCHTHTFHVVLFVLRPTFNRQAFRPFVFVMEIRIAYRSNLIGWMSALAEFSYMKIAPQHTMAVGLRWAFKEGDSKELLRWRGCLINVLSGGFY